MLQFGHVLVLFAAALLVVIAVHFMKLLDRTSSAWAGLVGAAVGSLGAMHPGSGQGRVVPNHDGSRHSVREPVAAMMPGLLAMFSFKGWMVVLSGILLLPIGFAIQAVALLKTGVFPRWASVLFLIGVLFVGVPDGVEIINLAASVLMAVALVPYGVRMLARSQARIDRQCWCCRAAGDVRDGQVLPIRRQLRDGRSTPLNGRDGDAARRSRCANCSHSRPAIISGLVIVQSPIRDTRRARPVRAVTSQAMLRS